MRGKGKWILLGILVAIVVSFSTAISFYTEILWFQEVDYVQVFLKILFTHWGIRVVQIAVFFLFLLFNFMLFKKALLAFLQRQDNPNVINLSGEQEAVKFLQQFKDRGLTLIFTGLSLFLAFFFSIMNPDAWQHFLFFIHSSTVGIVDPVLEQDIGFYMFQLPFLRYLYESISLLLGLTLILITGGYLLIGRTAQKPLNLDRSGLSHVVALGGLFLIVRGLGYQLNRFDLMFSQEGLVFGPGYTDVLIRMPVMNFLSIFLILGGILVALSAFVKFKKHIPVILGIWLIVAFIGGSIVPGVVQRFRVEPNEIALEAPYLENNIQFTRQAYGLEAIEEVDYAFDGKLTWDTIHANQGTIDNIRIWDWRPILQTYKQLEERRPYYVFERVDIDRYWIDGEYRQVMLAPRELDQTLLPQQARTWVNQALKYTHGIGMVMSPVNAMTREGFPDFMIRDIPPSSRIDIELTNPSIYFGEKAPEYVIANNLSEEFHFPSGQENIYYNYSGTGGVPMDSLFRRLAFAIRFGSFQILLAQDISNESRIMYDRVIHDRVRNIAPFLLYDGDPYTVIHDGQIYWIQDAYTTSPNYPYAEPFLRWGNYVRNSVKVVIDAYNGTVDYYVVDEEDPIIQTYQSIFPDLFKPFEEMPEGLQNHIRYPEDLFTLQSQILTTYHMQNFRVFYNKEDQWAIPQERYGDSTITMDPYYTLMQLPGSEELEFVLMAPFTPVGRNNLVAWMAAHCDPPNYGNLTLYKFPKDRLAFGPMQVEAQIDQHGEISRLISLWDQRGSRVIRGNLLVLPMDNAVLYVEPLFLQSEQTGLPQIRGIILSDGERVVMEETIEEALVALLGSMPDEDKYPELKEQVEEAMETPRDLSLEEPVDEDWTPGISPDFPEGDLNELILRAERLFEEGQQAMRDGNWSRYGDIQEELQRILRELATLIEEDQSW